MPEQKITGNKPPYPLRGFVVYRIHKKIVHVVVQLHFDDIMLLQKRFFMRRMGVLRVTYSSIGDLPEIISLFKL
jgi:hypothetical protein